MRICKGKQVHTTRSYYMSQRGQQLLEAYITIYDIHTIYSLGKVRMYLADVETSESLKSNNEI